MHYQHRGIDVRHGFTPPVLCVHTIDAAAGKWQQQLPAIALLTDLFGEEAAPRRADIRLGYDATSLYLHARINDTAVVCRPKSEPDSADFWQQDHIELRLLPDPQRDLATCQFLLAVSGKYLAGGDAAVPINYFVQRDAGGWSAQAQIPFARLGLTAVPRPGQSLRGVIGHLRWASGAMDAAVSSPVQIGFEQAERFGELRFLGPPQALTLQQVAFANSRLNAGAQSATLHLSNGGADDCTGTLLVADDAGQLVQSRRVQLGARQTCALTVDLPLQRPRYRRFDFGFCPENGQRLELGAISVRAAVPPVAAVSLVHPYLHFDAAGLAHLRQKAAAAGIDFPANAATADSAAAATAAAPFAFTAKCAGWFRVAKESMLRDGASGRRAASARIWQLLPESARDAFTELAATVTGTPETMAAILAGMNSLLDRPDLYDGKSFAGGKIPTTTLAALDESVMLNRPELRKHNRVLIQSVIECIHEYGMDSVAAACAVAERWLISGDDSLLAEACALAETAEQRLITECHIHLHTGGAASRIARVFDAMAPALSAPQRQAWTRLGRRFLELYLDSVRDYSWTVTCVPNSNAVTNGGAGSLALAMRNELPELAENVLYYSRKFSETFLDYCMGSAGGNTEGLQYWDYGLHNFILFAYALERVSGGQLEWFDRPQLCKAMNMVRLALCPDGGSHGQNDTIPLAVGGALAWFFAARYNDRFALWYGDHCRRWHAARLAAARPSPYAPEMLWQLLLRPELDEVMAQPEPLPTVIHLPDIEYAALRSSSNYDCRLMFGAKGSRPPYTHHNQADTGAFFLHVRGERLLIDPGYYKDAAKFHSLPVIDGVAPAYPSAYVGRVLACRETAELRSLSLEVTAAYATAATRVIRHFLLFGSEAAVIIDDIAPCGAGNVRAQYQCGGVTETLGVNAWNICGKQAILRCELFGGSAAGAGAGLRVELGAEVSLHDTHWGYHFADCRLLPVGAHYQAAAGLPLVTVCTDITELAAPPPARVEYCADVVRIYLPSGRVYEHAIQD